MARLRFFPGSGVLGINGRGFQLPPGASLLYPNSSAPSTNANGMCQPFIPEMFFLVEKLTVLYRSSNPFNECSYPSDWRTSYSTCWRSTSGIHWAGIRRRQCSISNTSCWSFNKYYRRAFAVRDAPCVYRWTTRTQCAAPLLSPA